MTKLKNSNRNNHNNVPHRQSSYRSHNIEPGGGGGVEAAHCPAPTLPS